VSFVGATCMAIKEVFNLTRHCQPVTRHDLQRKSDAPFGTLATAAPKSRHLISSAMKMRASDVLRMRPGCLLAGLHCCTALCSLCRPWLLVSLPACVKSPPRCCWPGCLPPEPWLLLLWFCTSLCAAHVLFGDGCRHPQLACRCMTQQVICHSTAAKPQSQTSKCWVEATTKVRPAQSSMRSEPHRFVA
jgi:hypothetical protein